MEKRPRQASLADLSFGLGVPSPALQRRVRRGAESRELDHMYGPGPPRRLDKIALQLDLVQVVVGDEERSRHSVERLLQSVPPAEIAHHRLHGRTSDRRRL